MILFCYKVLFLYIFVEINYIFELINSKNINWIFTNFTRRQHLHSSYSKFSRGKEKQWATNHLEAMVKGRSTTHEKRYRSGKPCHSCFGARRRRYGSFDRAPRFRIPIFSSLSVSVAGTRIRFITIQWKCSRSTFSWIIEKIHPFSTLDNQVLNNWAELFDKW